ncbi:MAG: DNA helicase PcrA [Clostridia bacterium]|nr:DNA helicase PcrA [Clostridia bacterium]
MQELLNKLNDKQRKAVLETEGPVLILAGAGSGKTTVLVNRIAYIISEKNVKPYNILSITFTNKAAREMKERISQMIGEMSNDMWIGTFHSVCVKILRRTIDRLGYDNSFVIYDTADSLTVIKDCLKELDINDKNFSPRSVLSAIGRAKDEMIDPERFENIYVNDFRMSVISKVYALYQKKLKKNNALDFDDIIVNTIRIFSENSDILENYQKRFRYILVDEYQDTNNAQYKLISMLAKGSGNLCVVGDDDQSIYKFRGANIRNILDFEREFPDAKVIKLEQNYRSTQTILSAANSVIHNNKGRKGKALWTQNTKGEKINVFTASNEHEEGQFIAKEIQMYAEEGGKFADCAILYRTNAQSRVLEEMLIRQAIPYRVLAGLRFYDRKEIKDIIAYLRVIQNPHDNVSLKRIINEPKRNIGAATLEKAQQAADEIDTSLFAIISIADKIPELSRASVKLMAFAELINYFIKTSENLPLGEFVLKVINDSGYMAMLELENTVEAQSRIENLREFMTVVHEHEKTTENASLATFLESVSLISDIDSYDEEQDAVVLMTIHSAKGLEFPVVFLSGMEEGIFPGLRSIGEEEEIEEERRLCYVAITRAKQKLYITNTESRTIYGTTTYNPPSRFLKEIPREYLNEKKAAKAKIKSFFGANKDEYKSHERKNIYIKPEKAIPEGLDFKAGDLVEHKKFGKGMVLCAQPVGNDIKLEIAFDSIGTKHLMAVFANLKKL